MVNFGYLYNDIVICKDSTDYLGYNVDPYGQSFFPKCISAWNGLAQEIVEANTLDLFKSKLAH